MKRRHGAGLDSAGKTIAHNQLGPAFQRIDKAVKLTPVVAIVRIGHDQILAARGPCRSADRGAIAPHRLVHDTGAERLRNLDRPVSRPIVADHHFAADATARKGGERFFDANAERSLLVQARE